MIGVGVSVAVGTTVDVGDSFSGTTVAVSVGSSGGGVALPGLASVISVRPGDRPDTRSN